MTNQQKLFGVCLAIAFSLVATRVRAAVISYEFTTNGTANVDVLGSASFAGVVSASHWNVNTTNHISGSFSGLIDSTGVATTVGGTYSGATFCFMDNASSVTNNQKLYGGAFAEGSDGGLVPVVLNLTGIPYTNYNLIVNVQRLYPAGNSNATIALTGGPTYTGVNFNNGDNVATSGSDGGPVFSRITGSSQVGNYLEYDGLTGLIQTLTINIPANTVNSGICDFQIVQATPEPASLSLLVLGGMLVLPRRRSTRA
jgi:hypothetical protein